MQGDERVYNILRSCLEQDQDADVRRAAVQALASAFGSREDTFTLLRSYIEQDQDAYVRGAAVQALASAFGSREDTFTLLRSYIEQDQDATVRAEAFLRWAQGTYPSSDLVLVSRDVDGIAPGIDPRQPIDTGRIQMVVQISGWTAAEVRSRYERLVDDFGMPLTLTWRESVGTGQDDT
jgi:hypothetical protein